MLGRTRTTENSNTENILGDVDTAELAAQVAELQALVGQLTGRVQAQFTTIAAHAQIAQENLDFARSEAQSNLEHTRDSLVELVEKCRRDVGVAADRHIQDAPAGSAATADPERLDRVEQAINAVQRTVENCFRRQNELADTMAAVLDTVLANDNDPIEQLALN